MELVTGDGRLVKSGARTVKNVTGYDVHRLVTGSLGTLGVITQVALKVRPLPQRSMTIVAPGATIACPAVVDGVPLVAGVAATDKGVEVRLEGWTGEVEALADATAHVIPEAVRDDSAGFPRRPWWTWQDAGTIVEAAVAPARLPRCCLRLPCIAALVGVGSRGSPSDDDTELSESGAIVASAGGVAPAIRGPGGLGGTALPGAAVHHRLAAAFDPAGVLAPGRSWSDPLIPG